MCGSLTLINKTKPVNKAFFDFKFLLWIGSYLARAPRVAIFLLQKL